MCYNESLSTRVPFTVSCMICVCLVIRSPSRPCSSEAEQRLAVRTQQRGRRPPEFGSTVPTITIRGILTTEKSETDREDCLMCKKFSRGPCGRHFTVWMDCTDENPGKDDNGEPLHLTKCSDFAVKLAECLEENVEYYSKNDDVDDDINEDPIARDGAMNNAWKEFVREIEDSIESGKFSLLPFPLNIQPKMEVRPPTHTGAAFFVPENDGQHILAAYILDDSLNVIAAASREDMYMNNHIGCVIQFKIVEGMKSATCRAIYDTAVKDDVVVYTRTMRVPTSQF